jgi:uncharacterized repeat protein (TIGR03803 family)
MGPPEMKTVTLALFCLASTWVLAQTYTETNLYSFGASSTDGTGPDGGLVRDAAGNLYGTTSAGGGSAACSGGCGTAFKLNTSNKETILHVFTGGSDGADPVASLTLDKSGNLYGTTELGGLGNGTVFKITAAGKYSILHTFGRLAGDGASPGGPLTLDADGNMYGTTAFGGGTGFGTVFRVSAKGVETILYNFTGGLDGATPEANVIRDAAGNIYGTATAGGANSSGVLFELSSQNVETVIYPFCSLADCADGGLPTYIVRNSQGVFFGNASEFGIIFEVTSEGVETALHSFCLPGGIDCDDGGGAIGPLLLSGGNIYGTASQDGATEGIVYELTTTGTETTLYNGSFRKGTFLFGGVVTDSVGNLYGTAAVGGSHGVGSVFKLTKNK